MLLSKLQEEWIDLVLVLRADTAVLFDRLSARGYNEVKRTENLECEIMQTCLEDAYENYDKSIVTELQSNSVEDLDSNIGKYAWVLTFLVNDLFCYQQNE